MRKERAEEIKTARNVMRVRSRAAEAAERGGDNQRAKEIRWGKHDEALGLKPRSTP